MEGGVGGKPLSVACSIKKKKKSLATFLSLRRASYVSWQKHLWVVSSAVICLQHVKLMGLWVLSPALVAISLSLWSFILNLGLIELLLRPPNLRT